MKIKTSELSGVSLDWAVAKALSVDVRVIRHSTGPCVYTDWLGDDLYDPSEDWAIGGPLIERFSVTLGKRTDCPPGPRQWDAFIDTKFCPSATYANFGSSPLIAACRAIVAAKLGDEVDVPEGLV